MKMWQFSIRQVGARPGRAVLTVLSIVIGVAAVVAVSESTTATRQAYHSMFKAINGKSDLEVTADSLEGVDQNLIDSIEAIPGVKAAVPLLQRPLAVSLIKEAKRETPSEDQTVDDWTRTNMQVLAIDPHRDHYVREFDVVEFVPGSWIDPAVNGKPPAKTAAAKPDAAKPDAAKPDADQADAEQDNEDLNKGLVLDAGFAKYMGVKLGDTARISTKLSRRRIDWKIVGMVSARGAAAMKQAGMAFMHIDQAQALMTGNNMADVLQIVLNPKVVPQEEMAAIAKVLPRGVTVSIPKANTQQADETMMSTEQGLDLATGLSLLVSVIIVLNTFLMNVAERRRQLSIMRAIGATRNQVMKIMLTEGVALGIFGTVIGLALGLFGAHYLSIAMSKLMQSAQPDVAFSFKPILKGTTFGLGVAFLATLVPAWLASKLTPLEGMSGVSQQDRTQKSPIYISIAGALALLTGGAVLAGCVLGKISIDASVPAAVAALLGCLALIPLVLTPWATAIRNILSPLFGTEGMLAYRQVLRRRVRTTLTVGVLFIALAVGIGMGTSIINSTQDVKQWFKRTVNGDFFVRSMMPNMGSTTAADLPDEMLEKLRHVDGVKDVQRVKFARVTLQEDDQKNSSPVAAMQADHPSSEASPSEARPNESPGDDAKLADRGQPVGQQAEESPRQGGQGRNSDLQLLVIVREYPLDKPIAIDIKRGDTHGLVEKLHDGQVVVGSVLSERRHLKVGDQLSIRTADGLRKVQIAAIANEYAGGGMTMYMQRQVAERLLHVEGADAFTLFVDQSKIPEIKPELEKLCKEFGVLLLSYEGFSGLVDGMMNGVVATLWVLLAIGFIAASFGIVNTLTMNVLEQTRELGMLRVVAMTKYQVRRTILAQAAIMALLGLTPGALVGLVVAYVMNIASRTAVGRDIDFVIYPGFVLGAFFGAILIVMIAAWLPARRATMLKLTDALHYE